MSLMDQITLNCRIAVANGVEDRLLGTVTQIRAGTFTATMDDGGTREFPGHADDVEVLEPDCGEVKRYEGRAELTVQQDGIPNTVTVQDELGNPLNPNAVTGTID